MGMPVCKTLTSCSSTYVSTKGTSIVSFYLLETLQFDKLLLYPLPSPSTSPTPST